MQNACRHIAIAALLGASAACNKQQPPPEQNIVIDTNAAMANADIETLPPDESSATPSNELINGADQPQVANLPAENESD
jgi:hypothetical protein